jgi:hypothetical protein
MHKLHKKTAQLQARIPYADQEVWKRMCADKQMSSSDALRAAVSRYAKKFGYKISAVNDEHI